MQINDDYELYFTIDYACSATQLLRSLDLQQQSNPLDWGYGGELEDRIKILVDKFERFFEKNDLECINMSGPIANIEEHFGQLENEHSTC